MKLRVFILFALLTIPSMALSEEPKGIQYALARYTFSNQPEPVRILYTSPLEENQPQSSTPSVSLVALKTSSNVFKSIEIGGSLSPSIKKSAATINLVARW